MSYVRDACESTVRRLIVQLDEHRMRAVEAFVVEQVLEQQLGHSNGACPGADLVGGEPGNARPNQAGADGNGAAGHTFSPADEDATAPLDRVTAGLRELRDAEVQTPGVLVEFEMEDVE